MKHIAQALLNAQKNIKNALKDAKNPHFKSDYASLESVIDATKEIANGCGILIVQGTGSDEFGQYVNTTLIHSESGESMSSKCYLVLDKHNMQGLGSAITYARRYGLAAMFCITQADDDGNLASFTPPMSLEDEMKNYRVDFGKKFIGKALHEISTEDLESTIGWFEDEEKRTGNPTTGKAKKFVDLALVYLNQGE